MITGSNVPSNTRITSYLSPEAETIIILFLCIAIIIAIILSIVLYQKYKENKYLKSFTKSDITEEEQQLINNYRNLNIQGKNIINNTCKSLIDNNLKSDNYDGG